MATLSARDRARLQGVHPDLVRWVEAVFAAMPGEAMVIEGLRSRERQAELKQAGKSKTMNSRHLTGHAVDIAPLVAGAIPWDRFDLFQDLAELGKAKAARLGIRIVWGGDWPRFRDGPHWELDRKAYPAPVDLPREIAAEAPYDAPPVPVSPMKAMLTGMGGTGVASTVANNLDRFPESVQIALIVLVFLTAVGGFVAWRKGWLK